MSETPHCLSAALGARCCRIVNFCCENRGVSHQFLRILVTQIVASKRRGSGSNEIAGSTARTALKVLGNSVNLHLRVRPCI